ncbi:MAG: DMT family transporter [Halobacteriales archaeon]|nr:DMT family transporter [Halobacteriales archaeon]
MAALAVAVLAVSTSAILIRFSDAPSLVKAFYRVLFTVGLLAPVALVRYRAELVDLSRRQLLSAGLTGVALAVHFGAWFESLEWTSVAASVTLVQAQPVFVAVGAFLLLDERLNRTIVAGIAVALAGAVAMTLPGASLAGVRPAYGNALALLGALMLAAYFLAGRSLRQEVALVPYVMVVYSACAAALLAFALVDGAPVGLGAYPPREWLLFLAMAVGPGLLGHTVINWALEHVESSVVSVTLLGEPVGSTVLAVLLLGEVPGAPTVVGGAVVLAGIYLTVRGRA